MATLSKEQVQHIAALCRLALTEEETEIFRSQLSGILDYVDKLQELETRAVEPTNQVTEQVNVRRDDVAKPWSVDDMERLRSLAPSQKDNGFRVPHVF